MHIASLSRLPLTVECDIEDVVPLDKIYIFVKELNALLVVQHAVSRLLLAAKTLASVFLYLAEARLFIRAKLHDVFNLLLVQASVQADCDLMSITLAVKLRTKVEA